MRLTFRSKLLASHVGLVLAVVLIATFELNRSLGDDLSRQLDQRLEDQALGAAQWVTGGRRHVDRLAGRLAVIVGAQVTIVDASGAVVGASDEHGAGSTDTENQGAQPEIIAARQGITGRAMRPSAEGVPMKYVAVPAGDDLVLRLGLPLSGIDATLRAMQRRLLFASGLAVAAALALGLVASRIAARPLRAMTRSAARIADGDYDIPVATTSPDEFGMLSRALAKLAVELKGRIGDLTAERDRLSAILAGMAEGVLVTSADGVVLVANPAASHILGAARSLVGLKLDEAVSVPVMRELIEHAARTGETRETETLPDDGGGRQLAIYVRPLAREAGGGTVAVVRDMTQLRRFETMRRDFVANVSHELRTPVTAIQGYAETVLRGTADEKTTRQFLEIIHRNAERVGRLLEDLLRLSALEAKGPDQVQREPVPLGPIVNQVVETMRQRASAASTVSVEVAADAVVLGDPAGLEQVIENLVDNALKYGKPGGTVRIQARRGQRGAPEPRLGSAGGRSPSTTSANARSGARVQLSVADDGDGIEARHLPRLFERFYRVDPGRARDRGGTGLGLSIVKHLVESMGGSVRVESDVGGGSRFVVELEAAEAGAA